MAKQIHQIVGVTAGSNMLINHAPVVKLGIQAPANTIFYINGSNSPIKIGSYGIYELDLTHLNGQIFSLVFDKTLSNVVIDIVYEGG